MESRITTPTELKIEIKLQYIEEVLKTVESLKKEYPDLKVEIRALDF